MINVLTGNDPETEDENAPWRSFWTHYWLAGDGVYKFFLGEFDFATPIAKYALD